MEAHLDHHSATSDGRTTTPRMERNGMFFTRVGTVFAHLVFWLSTLRVCVGFFLAFVTPDMATNRAAASRYLGASNSGEAITEGMMYILLAVALGVLCEISSKRNKPDEQA